MNIPSYLKARLAVVVEEVKNTLPEGIEFDFRKHVLPLFLPFMAWKDELRDRPTLRADLMAGLVGAIIVLPQGLAFAMIAGLPPVYGLYTAMVTPIVAALFGASRHLVVGPTTSISLVVFSVVSKLAAEGSPEYLEKVLLLTFLAGLIQLAFGLGRLGRYTGFVSHTVVVGFTTGVGLLIITNQMRNVLGIDIANRAPFVETWEQVFVNLRSVHWPVLLTAFYTLVAAMVFKRYYPKFPHLLAGLLFGTALAWGIGGPEAGIPMMAEVPRQLPPLSWPGFSANNFHGLLGGAFVIAVQGLIEGVTIAKAIGARSGQPLNSNQEFVGLGLANVVGSFFSCYAGSGSFTRSGANFQAGAKTPMAVIFASLILMAIVLVMAPWAKLLPAPALSGLILIIGWNLIDAPHIREIRKASKADNFILGVTFFTALFAELELAIYFGVLLSLYFFLRRTSAPNIAVMVPNPTHPKHEFVNLLRREDLEECPQIKIIRIDGHLYFGAIDHVAAAVREHRKGSEKHMILLANGINYVDLDGAEWLAREAAFWKKKGGGLYIVRLKIIAQDIMEAGGFMDAIGRENFFNTKTDAIAEVYRKLERPICKTCPKRIFIECAKDPRLPKLKI